MIKIGDKLFAKEPTIDETLRVLRDYLNKNGIILVDEFDVPYSEEQIINLLGNEQVEFNTKSIVQLEKETVAETLEYIDRVERKMNEIINCDDPVFVFKWFPEIVSAFIELEKISNYFNSDIISLKKIEVFAQKGLSQIKEQNDSYLREIIEYEFITMISDFKKFLIRGKSDC
ncbi:MAG: hypothetical protein K6T65_08180 [Peptococcaceae bacterium]|nr:hypothetical protein [Peptococcaceae bacterium]